MKKIKSLSNADIFAIIVSAFFSLLVSAGHSLLYRIYYPNSPKSELITVLLSIICIGLSFLIYLKIGPYILARFKVKVEHIHTSFITSTLLPSYLEDEITRFNVDAMYTMLTSLVEKAKSVKIVDNTTSQLDHVSHLNSRHTFLQTIETRLLTDDTFRYDRIELVRPLDGIENADSFAEAQKKLTGATKTHCKTVSNYPNAAVYIYPTNRLIGTYLIFDERILCFQIDGVGPDDSQPSDLIIITIDNPNEIMLKTYAERFERLRGHGKTYKKDK